MTAKEKAEKAGEADENIHKGKVRAANDLGFGGK